MNTLCLHDGEAVEPELQHFKITEMVWKSSDLITRSILNKFSVIIITKCKKLSLADD